MFAYVSTTLQRAPRVLNVAVKGVEGRSKVGGGVSVSKRVVASRKRDVSCGVYQKYVRKWILGGHLCNESVGVAKKCVMYLLRFFGLRRIGLV